MTALQHARQCYAALKSELKNTDISFFEGDTDAVDKHFENALIFNRRINQNPFIIVYCTSAKEVQIAYNLAIANELPIKVRAGGHDHEGECSGTNTVVIDVSKMKNVSVDENGLARIEPGQRFITLTTELADKDVMLPHGTCATVGITGFTLGGGWGPWTRKEGMCCEHLMGADLVLGNGELVKVDAKLEKDGTYTIPPLLWALRGGGGMSYGIVTELRIQTFPLPTELIKFELHWNPYQYTYTDDLEEQYPTLKILNAWEFTIKSDKTPQLIGTNLKINGKPNPTDAQVNPNTVVHNCVMYGYWQGSKIELEAFVKKYFGAVPPVLKIDLKEDGSDSTRGYGQTLMSSWDRESLHEVQTNMPKGMLQGEPIPPDYDEPAPHKITNRLVNGEGLDARGYSQLLESLTSPLILEGNRLLGLFQYVTLGAIVGDYYHKNSKNKNSAFPYKDRLYTIQYQTWWNEKEMEKALEQDAVVYRRTNRALDWMEVCRDCTINNTGGAFISFKDNSVPTKTYFGTSYKQLVNIKEMYSKDQFNHLRSRKTII